MKIMHLSDLHIGKRLNAFSLIEDQKYILEQIIKTAEKEHPDAILIAGDVYDKSIPSEEAVLLLDQFISTLARKKIKTFIISGNHDSAERLSFGSELMKNNDIFITRSYNGTVPCHTLCDEYGDVNIYMLPFVKPSQVRAYHPDAQIETYTDALRTVIDGIGIDKTRRNIFVCHQFVTGAQRSESEIISVGGSDNVDASVFEDFDYVALGHIHGPQNIGSEKIRYCGTPLKYSFSEENHSKSVTMAEFKEKGDMTISTIPLSPLRDLRTVRGFFDDIENSHNHTGENTDDYVQVVLTDEEDVPDAMDRLRAIYPYIMQLKYDNRRTRENARLDDIENIEEKSPLELFSELYQKMNNKEMTTEQTEYMSALIDEIWSE